MGGCFGFQDDLPHGMPVHPSNASPVPPHTPNRRGTAFKAQPDIFLAFPDSMLGQIFSGRHAVKPNALRRYIFDRNASYFEPILEFYRNPEEVIVNPNINVKGVEAEARFFGMYKAMFTTEGKKKQRERRRKREQGVAAGAGAGAGATGGGAASAEDKKKDVKAKRGKKSAKGRGRTMKRGRSSRRGDGGSESPSKRFQKTMMRHIVPGASPATFFVRANERLAVDSASGIGRLCIDVFDDAGQLRVKGGIVYDSNAAVGFAGVGWGR